MGEQPASVDQLHGLGAPAPDQKSEHASETSHLRTGRFITRVTRQPGMEHLFYLRMDVEPFRQAKGVCIMHPHPARSEEHTSELQSLMRISYAVFCLKKTNLLANKQIQQHTSNYLL